MLGDLFHLGDIFHGRNLCSKDLQLAKITFVFKLLNGMLIFFLIAELKIMALLSHRVQQGKGKFEHRAKEGSRHPLVNPTLGRD